MFSEALDPTYAEDLFNYAIQAADGSFILAQQIVSRPSAEQVVVRFDSAPSPGQSYVFAVRFMCDLSGDCAQNQNVPLQFETEPPVVACGVAVNTLSPANNQLVDVGLAANSTEGILQLQVFSDEPELSVLDDAVLNDGSLQLRARRNPTLDGRVYLIVVTSTDACGNIGVCCRTVVAPVNGSQAALDAVNAQAAVAQAQCSPQGGPSTPYRMRLPIAAASAAQATANLIESTLQATVDRKHERTLCAALNAATASFERGRHDIALNQLRAFQNKIATQLGPTQPTLADALIQAAQDIIDSSW
jgi:hypothetical protein